MSSVVGLALSFKGSSSNSMVWDQTFLDGSQCRLTRACKLMLLFSVTMSTGCGGRDQVTPNTAIAIGEANFDGRPITGGMITIVSVEDARRRASGLIRPDGTFRLEGAPIGASRVLLDTTVTRMGDASKYVRLPQKYAFYDSTDLTVDLEAGENEGVVIQCSGS